MSPGPEQALSPGRRWWPVLAPLAVLAIAVSLVSPAGRHQWALSLIRQPAPYTVLSFSEPADLPVAVSVNRPITVSFTVGNHEGRRMAYRYILSASSRRSSAILGGSARIIAPGATWNVTATVRPACAASPCRIEVSLPGHPETIDFLVSLTAHGARRG